MVSLEVKAAADLGGELIFFAYHHIADRNTSFDDFRCDHGHECALTQVDMHIACCWDSDTVHGCSLCRPLIDGKRCDSRDQGSET